jgi:hypothetical protein
MIIIMVSNSTEIFIFIFFISKITLQLGIIIFENLLLKLEFAIMKINVVRHMYVKNKMLNIYELGQ